MLLLMMLENVAKLYCNLVTLGVLKVTKNKCFLYPNSDKKGTLLCKDL